MILQEIVFSLRRLASIRLLLVTLTVGAAELRSQSLAWTQRNAGAPISSYNGAAFGAGKYVVIATSADTRKTPLALVSADGVAWTANSLPAGGSWTTISFGNGLFVATGGTSTDSAGIITSADGVDWNIRDAGTGPLFAVAATGGRFVAVGADNGGRNAAISTDGATWSRVAVGTDSGAMAGVVGHPSLRNFVAWNSTGNTWQSTDGAAWARVSVLPVGSSNRVISVVVAGSTYLATVSGTSGNQFYSSADGISWQQGPKLTEPAIGSSRIGSFFITGVTATDSVVSGNAIVAVAGFSSTAFNDPAGFFLFQSAPYSVVGTGSLSIWDSVQLPYTLDSRDVTGVRSSWIYYANGLFLTSTSAGTLLTATTLPSVVRQPLATQNVAVGDSAAFTFAVSGPALSFQWSRNGVAISGATDATYTIPSVGTGNAGTYTAVATGPYGTVTSAPAVLTIAPPRPGRIINLSILTNITPEAPAFKVGTVIGGGSLEAAPKPVVIRAVGPSLAPLGVTTVLADPTIRVFAGSSATAQIVAANDNWGGGSALSATMSQVGAFPLINDSSRDAVVARGFVAGDYVVEISGVGGEGGTVLAEIYDASTATTGPFSTLATRLINVSVLKQIGAELTAGFVIGGPGPRTVLVRAVGPGLAPFGVTELLADPKLELFDGVAKSMATNDNWGGSAAMSDAFKSVGAFALDPASKDAALLSSLTPGNYTVRVNGVGGATGVALVEVYEVP